MNDPAPARPTPHLLLLGGCTLDTVTTPLVDWGYVTRRQIWRVPLVPLTAAPAEMDLSAVPSEAARRFLARELSKARLAEIVAADCDAILMDFVSDSAERFLVLDDTIITDPRNDIYGAEYKNVDLSEVPTIANARTIDVGSSEFLNLWKQSFEKFHNAVMSRGEKLRPIFVFDRNICTYSYREKTEQKLDGGEWISEQTKIFAEINTYALGFPHVYRLATDRILTYTAPDAPFGEWFYHSVEPFFVRPAQDMLRHLGFAETDVEQFLAHWLSDSYRKASDRLSDERAQSAHRIAEMEAELADRAAKIHSLNGKLAKYHLIRDSLFFWRRWRKK